MQSHLILLIGTIFLFNACTEEPFKWSSQYDLSIMSFNIRYDEPADGENQWSNRKESILEMWSITNPSIVGIQEGLYHQVEFLKDNLTAYDYVGVGRDDGQISGEYAAIYYIEDHYEILETNRFWLSETPDIPSLGWDANNIRIVTWAHFKDIGQNRTFFVFNTHFDHKGKTAQEESAKLLAQKIQEIVTSDIPVFITGDFNVLISNSIMKHITEDFFDARRFADNTDNEQSFNLWGKWWFPNRNIDFIFYKNIHALAFRTVIEDYGVPYISDHYPLITHFNYLD